MEHLKRETALSLRPGKIARAWLRLLVVVVCRIPRGQWRTGRLRRLPRSRDSATLVPGILFGKQATMSITKNDKNTRTTGRPTSTKSRAAPGQPDHRVARVARRRQRRRRTGAEGPRRRPRTRLRGQPAARALASAQSHSVAVLVPSLANLLFIETLEAIHAVLRPQGLEVLIGNFPLLAQRGRGPDPQLPGLPAARPAADRLRAHRRAPGG